MTSYFDHHHGSQSRIESDIVDCPDILVSEATTTEERAAFIWTVSYTHLTLPTNREV